MESELERRSRAARQGWETRRRQGTARALSGQRLEEAAAMYRSGQSLREIAGTMFMSRGAVRKALVAHGVRLRPKGGRPNEVRVDDDQVAAAVRAYESGMTIEQVAAALGISYNAAYHRLTRLGGVRLRPPGLPAGDPRLGQVPPEDLRRTVELYEMGLSQRDVASRLGIGAGTVSRRLRIAGVRARPTGVNLTRRTATEKRDQAARGWATRRTRPEREPELAPSEPLPEDASAPTSITSRRRASAEPRVRVPSLQLAMAIHAAARGMSDAEHDSGHLTALCERLAVSERAVWAWRTGERPTVELSVADRVLVELDLLWWDVWNERTVRLPLLRAAVMRSERRTRRGRQVTYWSQGERGYGDAGPDLETLAAITATWDGDASEATAA